MLESRTTNDTCSSSSYLRNTLLIKNLPAHSNNNSFNQRLLIGLSPKQNMKWLPNKKSSCAWWLFYGPNPTHPTILRSNNPSRRASSSFPNRHHNKAQILCTCTTESQSSRRWFRLIASFHFIRWSFLFTPWPFHKKTYVLIQSNSFLIFHGHT